MSLLIVINPAPRSVTAMVLAVVGAALGTAILPAQQATLPSPAANGNLAPTALSSYPWNRVGSFVRVMQFYGNGSFAAQGINFPIEIQSLDTFHNTTNTTGVATYPNVAVDMSTGAPGAHANVVLSQPFAAQHGMDRVQVFAGSVTTIAVAGPDYFAPITLSTPFQFDPTAGADLVVDIVNDGALATGIGTASYGPNAAGSLGSRIYSTSFTAASPTALPSAGDPGFAPQLRLGYVPAGALRAAFAVDLTAGAAPLAVRFTDLSTTNAPGGVLGWTWDFDGDGTPDSTVQNPTFSYAACGTYDVTLTVVDGTSNPASLTRSGLIEVDPLTASFTAAVGAAQAVSFTDTSQLAPTSWAWDFDDDGTVDSTLQNPTHIYPGEGIYTCALTVTNGCRSAMAAQEIITRPRLCTTFADNNGGGIGWADLFDVDVTAPGGLLVTALSCNFGSAPGGMGGIDVYIKRGTSVGFERDGSRWLLAGSGTTAVVAPRGSPTRVDIDDIYLPPGLHGIAVHFVLGSGAYTNGTGSNQSYSNSELTVTLGSVTSAPFAGALFTPRVWNGCIEYETAPGGFFAAHKPGCDGSNGRVLLTSNDVPRSGQTVVSDISAMPANAVAVMLLGYTDTMAAGMPLPLDLGVYGMTGCSLNVEPFATFLVLGDGTGQGTWALSIPNNPAFVGGVFWEQVLVVDLLVNPLGAILSNSAAGRVGR